MGRPRKPDYLKLVSGTLRKHRVNTAAPKPPRKRPRRPLHLSERAKPAWNEAADIAARRGVLTVADGLPLEMLAEAIADLREARAALAKPLVIRVTLADGQIIERELAAGGDRYYWAHTKNGPVQRKRPELGDIADADRRISAWLSKFGLSRRTECAPPVRRLKRRTSSTVFSNDERQSTPHDRR